MWKNYFKIAFRNIWKQKTFSSINIMGLAFGMACCFLTVLYFNHEAGYDQTHTYKDRLYRLNYHLSFSNESEYARVPPPVGPKLKDFFPEMEAVTRLYPRNISIRVVDTDKQFEMEEVYFADSTTNQVFDFDFLHGNPNTALDAPFSVVLTDKTALQLFGRTDVLGEKLALAKADNFRVTGVVKALPDQTHFNFNLLVPYRNMVDVEPAHAQAQLKAILEQNWIATHSYTYVLLKENQDFTAINSRFKDFIQKFGHEQVRDKQDFELYPVENIHLYSEASSEQRPAASLNLLYLFLSIGLITLLIACFNFINLSTATSLNRAKEVGVRKVLGARRSFLVSQFLGESLLLSFFAFLVAMLIVQLALPYLNELTGLEMAFAPLQQLSMLGGFALVFVLAALVAGSYPAFYASRFLPVEVLKGGPGSNKKPGGVRLRKALITLQFLVAIAFISGASIVYLQLNYLRNQPLGFDKELMLAIPMTSSENINSLFRPGDPAARERMNTFDEIIQTSPNIKAATQCANLPGAGSVSRNVWTDSVPQTDNFFTPVLAVDYDYVETFNLELAAGRDFDLSFGTDHLSSFVINESAVERLKWGDAASAIGQRLTVEGKEGTVVGVLKNYHFRSLMVEIEPLIMEIRPGAFSYFAVRVDNSNLPETLKFIEDKWKTLYPEKVFEYTFLEESLNEAYDAEERIASIIGYFAFIAILISCFGLFGLAALMTQNRFKEIGIRKVLGASVGQILRILATDFLWLIAIAMIMALPLTWYFVNRWMQDFAYRIDFPWWVPIGTGLLVILIAFLTISSQTIRAAMSNPVDAIRTE
ncbi:MAG: ABC transporter permease [Bacteroidota bacterium]